MTPGPSETDRGPFRGIAVSLTSDAPRAESSDGARADGPLPARCRSVPPGPGGPHPPAPARADGDRAAAERLPRGARAPRSPSCSGRSPNRVSSALARVFALWRTGLPRPVLVLQGGDALNYFGTGLLLPFEIIYLHAVRGFSTATAGLVLATVMGTAAVVTLPSGALLDRFSAKRILIAGTVLNGLGYGGLAFVDRPWQGFVCSAVGGAGFGPVGTAGQVLTLTLVPAEQRAASTALRRVAGNFGLGLGATVAGFIVAATHHHLQAFQGLYLFDAVTFVVFALVVLVWIPDPGLAAPSASEGVRGFRAVARDRLLLALIAGNLALVMIGGAFFSFILPPFAVA